MTRLELLKEELQITKNLHCLSYQLKEIVKDSTTCLMKTFMDEVFL